YKSKKNINAIVTIGHFTNLVGTYNVTTHPHSNNPQDLGSLMRFGKCLKISISYRNSNKDVSLDIITKRLTLFQYS
ncbi:hypothetical protein CR513_24204, partial [Mucuna pruriens]